MDVKGKSTPKAKESGGEAERTMHEEGGGPRVPQRRQWMAKAETTERTSTTQMGKAEKKEGRLQAGGPID